MARYQKKKPNDFGLGKPTKSETAAAQKISNMSQGKAPSEPKSKLSAAMYTWAKTNMSKLKNPTKAQKKIFSQYKAMKAAGDNPANPKPRPNKTSVTSKPANVKPAQPVKKPAKPSAQANKGSGRDGKFGAGTYGKGRPSDKKPTSSSRRTRRQNRRSTGVRGASTKPIDQLKAAIKAVDSKLKLTHKKGDIKKVGGNTFRWNGQRWQKLNRPF